MTDELDSTIEVEDSTQGSDHGAGAGNDKPAAQPAASSASAPAGLDPKAFATELAKAMRAPENQNKAPEEVKKDLIDELLSGKEVDVDKSYVGVLKHFQAQGKAQAAQIAALEKRLSEYEPQIQSASRSAQEQKFIQEAGGVEAYNSAKERAIAAAHDILGTDPATYKHEEDQEGGATFARVANAQYQKFIKEGREGAAPVAKKATATKLPTGNTKGQATPNSSAARLSQLRSGGINFED